MWRTSADDCQELMELCASGLPIGTLVLPPTIVEADEEDHDDEEG